MKIVTEVGVGSSLRVGGGDRGAAGWVMGCSGTMMKSPMWLISLLGPLLRMRTGMVAVKKDNLATIK
jgi:hypothetical protein